MNTIGLSMERKAPHHSARFAVILQQPKSRIIFLQVLVGIILSYEFLFSHQPLLSFNEQVVCIAVLWAATVALVVFPRTWFATSWVAGTFLVVDTTLSASGIYFSGNASINLYVSFFLLLLVAASVRSLQQRLSLSLLVCGAYGFVLYQGILMSGSVSVGTLLGLPVLFIMAVFYGLTLELLAQTQEEKVALGERVSSLRWEETQLLKTKHELEQHIQCLQQDLSRATHEVHQGQVERQSLERRLVHGQKMEGVGRLAGVVARDFKGLLRVIGGQAGQLLKGINPRDPLRAHVEKILQVGDRAAVLTGHLQQFSFQNYFQPEAVPMNRTVEELLPLLRGLVRQHHVVQVTLDPKVGCIQADRGQLELVVMNLVVNARDAMSRGGHLTLETRHLPNTAPPANHPRGQELPSSVQLAVSDTGCGMNTEIEARLFEPFFSTKEHGAGTGLATVYGIVKQCGGDIEVRSEKGKGTTCIVSFPALTVQVPADNPHREPSVSRAHETVLLVEEEEVFRKLSRISLQREGYQVLEARTPVEGLLMAQKYTGSIHLLACNTLMADINGRDLADRLMTLYPTMKAIYLGGYTDEIILNQRIPGTGFLQKPCTQKELIQKVREVLDPAPTASTPV